MSSTLLLALIVNIAVGAYLTWGYPRTVQRSFRGRTPPPAFALLVRVLRPFGIIVMVGSVIYALLVIGGFEF